MEKIIREDSDDPNSDIETSWLLESQLRSFCEDLNKEIQSLNCEEYVSELNTDLADDDDVLQMKDSRLTTFESVGGRLKGLVAIDGCFISEAKDIVTRFKSLPKGSIKTQITSNNPWRLIQIQNIVNYLKLCLDCLESRLYDSKKKSFKIELTNYSDIAQIVRTIKTHSQCCIDNLISPIDTIEQDYQVFSPKIPDGLHIHFVIKNNLLVITSEHVTAVNPDFIAKVLPKGKSSSDKEKKSQKPKTRINYAICEIKIPKFDTIMALLLRCWELCNDLDRKLVQLNY